MWAWTKSSDPRMPPSPPNVCRIVLRRDGQEHALRLQPPQDALTVGEVLDRALADHAVPECVVEVARHQFLAEEMGDHVEDQAVAFRDDRAHPGGVLQPVPMEILAQLRLGVSIEQRELVELVQVHKRLRVEPFDERVDATVDHGADRAPRPRRQVARGRLADAAGMAPDQGGVVHEDRRCEASRQGPGHLRRLAHHRLGHRPRPGGRRDRVARCEDPLSRQAVLIRERAVEDEIERFVPQRVDLGDGAGRVLVGHVGRTDRHPRSARRGPRGTR